MKRLLNASEIRKLVFGSPSVQLGDKTISITEVSKAIFNNKKILEELSDKEYKKIINQATNAKPDFANYGCYGTGENEQFFAVEFYKFVANNDVENCLFVVIAKPFTCKFCGGKTADDVIVDYNGEVESDCFFGSYTNVVAQNEIVVNNQTIKLIKNIPINTTPEKFYAMLKGE